MHDGTRMRNVRCQTTWDNIKLDIILGSVGCTLHLVDRTLCKDRLQTCEKERNTATRRPTHSYIPLFRHINTPMRTGLHSGDTGCRRSHHLGSWHVCGTCCSLQHRRKQTISTAAIKRSDALNVSDVELFKAARQYSEGVSASANAPWHGAWLTC